MKKVVLLGSTGSIGVSTCKVAEDLSEDIVLVGLAAGRNVSLLGEQVKKFQPRSICVTEQAAAKELSNQYETIKQVDNDGLH